MVILTIVNEALKEIDMWTSPERICLAFTHADIFSEYIQGPGSALNTMVDKAEIIPTLGVGMELPGLVLLSSNFHTL